METGTIICGNSEEILKTCADSSIDLIVTDIPYGISYKSNKQNCDTRGSETVHKDREEYFEQIQGDATLPVNWLTDAYRILKDGSAMCVFCHWSKWHLLFHSVVEVGFSVKGMIVLNKSNHGMGCLYHYAPKHELLMFATKGKHVCHFREKRMNDVWDVPVKFSGAKRFHPNEKPLSWLTPCIENSSEEGMVVLDPFAGSGSTGMACKNLKRDFIMIDVDEKYCTIMRDRLGIV